MIAGYIPSAGALGGLGALMLARVEGNQPVYAGRVGTGYDANPVQGVVQSTCSAALRNAPISALTMRRRWIASFVKRPCL